MLFVFDTNIYVSAALFKNSTPAEAVQLAISSGKLLFSLQTKAELWEVLSRPKFNKYISLENKDVFLKQLEFVEVLEQPKLKITDCRDLKDNMFLELALSVKADCIISGDNDLLEMNPYLDIPILTVSVFLDKFGK